MSKNAVLAWIAVMAIGLIYFAQLAYVKAPDEVEKSGLCLFLLFCGIVTFYEVKKKEEERERREREKQWNSK
jgi:hypothetical protein